MCWHHVLARSTKDLTLNMKSFRSATILLPNRDLLVTMFYQMNIIHFYGIFAMKESHLKAPHCAKHKCSFVQVFGDIHQRRCAPVPPGEQDWHIFDPRPARPR
jgi:hypothetical protein